MDTGTWTLVIGGTLGLALVLFGAWMLVTGGAPAGTMRAFRNIHDAGLYHLLFGVGLLVLVVGTKLPGDSSSRVAAVLAVMLAVVAVVRYRPQAKRTKEAEVGKKRK